MPASEQSKKIRKKIELSYDNVRWFEQAYPNSSLTWIMDMLLERFRLLHSDATPAALAQVAAELVKEKVE